MIDQMSSDLNGFRTLLKLKKPVNRYAVFGIILAKELYDNSYSPDFPIGNLTYIRSFNDEDESYKFVAALMKIVPTARLVVLDAVTPFPISLHTDPERKIELSDETWERMDEDFSAMVKRSEQSRVKSSPEASEVSQETIPETPLDKLRSSFVNLSFNMSMLEENLKIVKSAYEGLKTRQKEFQRLMVDHPDSLSLLEKNLEESYGQKDPVLLHRLKGFLSEVDGVGVPRIVTERYVPNLEGLYAVTPLRDDSPEQPIISGSPVRGTPCDSKRVSVSRKDQKGLKVKKKNSYPEMSSPKEKEDEKHSRLRDEDTSYISPDPPIFSIESKTSYPDLPPSGIPSTSDRPEEVIPIIPTIPVVSFVPSVPSVPSVPVPSSLPPLQTLTHLLVEDVKNTFSEPPVIPLIPYVSSPPTIPLAGPVPVIPSIPSISSVILEETSIFGLPQYYQHSQDATRT